MAAKREGTPPPADVNSPSPEPSSAAEPNATRWFAEQVHVHDGQLRSWLRGAYPSARDVDDIVQESYLRIWKARAIRPIASTKAFLFTVAKRVALDVLRRDRASPVMAVPDLPALPVTMDAANAAEAACTTEEIAMLADALDSLQPRCRQIIVLRKFQNIPQKEVARQLGISEITVQEQVYRGLRRMEATLRKRGVIRDWSDE